MTFTALVQPLDSGAGSSWLDRDSSPMLRGNYRPVEREITAVDLPVQGHLPPQLDGMFLRNGPNPMLQPRGRYHPFDGDGMIHAVTLSGGRATYRNRWVQSRQLAYERRLGRSVYWGMNDGFRLPEPEHVAAAGWTKNVANINVIGHGDRLLAVSEHGGPIALDYELRTLGSARFGGQKLFRYTGHPHRVPGTDQLVGLAYSALVPFLRYLVIEPDGTLSTNDIVNIPDPVMIHDMCICGDYVVFLDAPAVLDLSGGQGGQSVLSWQPKRGCRFGVLPLRGRGWEVRWFEVEPCYIYHYFNGWQQGDELVFVSEWYDRASVAFPEEGVEALAGVPMRFSLNLRNGVVTRRQLDDGGMALPVVDLERYGQKTQHGYAVAFDTQDLDHWDKILRIDLDTGATNHLHVGEGRCVSEPSYVPDPEDDREEAGFLAHFVTDLSSMRSELWLLRAAAIEAGPIARVALPQRVPHGFHGCWLPTSDMGSP